MILKKNFKLLSLIAAGIIMISAHPAFAMHITEGLLPPAYAIGYWIVAIIFCSLGVKEYKIKAAKDPMFKQLVGVFTALIFIISLLPIPVPITGTCSHPTGTPLAAIFLGPFITCLMSAAGLLIHALFLAHGGLSTLGANILAMGVFGGLTGFIIFKGSRKAGLNLFVAGLLAGLIGDLVAYIGTSIQLAFAIHGTTNIMNVFWMIYAGFLPSQLPLAILEGLMTALTLNYIGVIRPDMLYKFRIIGKSELEKLIGGIKNEQAKV